MQDGVMMVDNKTMLCNHSKCTPLTKTYTCKDGWRISPEGTVTKPDGDKSKATADQLKNAFAQTGYTVTDYKLVNK